MPSPCRWLAARCSVPGDIEPPPQSTPISSASDCSASQNATQHTLQPDVALASKYIIPRHNVVAPIEIGCHRNWQCSRSRRTETHLLTSPPANLSRTIPHTFQWQARTDRDFLGGGLCCGVMLLLLCLLRLPSETRESLNHPGQALRCPESIDVSATNTCCRLFGGETSQGDTETMHGGHNNTYLLSRSCQTVLW